MEIRQPGQARFFDGCAVNERPHEAQVPLRLTLEPIGYVRGLHYSLHTELQDLVRERILLQLRKNLIKRSCSLHIQDRFFRRSFLCFQ